MNYSETLSYLYNQFPMFHRIGAAAYKASLDNTLAISRLLDQPELKYRTIHIAGTNGKGSTSHFLASILQEAGYKTGLFTSPHLKDFRERIKVNGKMIPKAEVTRFVKTYRKNFESIQPSFFEWTFGLASDFFALEKVDVAVMETGMGGRLDSTNIIEPDLSVITNIGMDHMQFLGRTLEAIAAEKAGIIKTGVPLVIGETQVGPANVFIRKASLLEAPLTFADQLFSISNSGLTRHHSSLLWIETFNKENNIIEKFFSPLAGTYQLKNILTVLQSVAKLQQSGYRISKENLYKGIRNVIRNTGLQGRWQTLSRTPLTIADIGHNKDGVLEVVRQIRKTPFRNLHFVLGVVNDKDVMAMLNLLPREATYYFCKADIPRGLDASMLREQAIKAGLQGEVYPSVRSALFAAQKASFPDDLVFVGGSTFVVAEVV